MKKTTKEIFEANDGKIFDVESECLAYEKEQARISEITTYWRVLHKPDTAEGRGYYGMILLSVECHEQETVKLFLEDWAHRTFGRKVTFVMDVSAMPAWVIIQADKDEFKNTEAYTQVGDYRYKAERMWLEVGPATDGLVVVKGKKAEK